MRLAIFPLLTAGFITGCVTAKLGMTVADFTSACESHSIDGATEIPLSTGDRIVMCPTNSAGLHIPQYKLFEEGVLIRLLPKDKVMVLLEHDRCIFLSAARGSDAYAGCRSCLAQLREKHRQWYEWQIGPEFGGITVGEENRAVLYLYRPSPGNDAEPLVTEEVSVTINNEPTGDLKYSGYARVELESGNYTVGPTPEPLRPHSFFTRKEHADKPIDILPLDLEIRPNSISFVSVSAEWEEGHHPDPIGCAIGIFEGTPASVACKGSVSYERLLVEFAQTSEEQALADLTEMREAKALQ